MIQKGQIQVLIGVLIFGLLALGGYLVYQNQTKSTSSDQQFLPVPIEKGHPKLESALYQLINSQDPQEFAKTRDLDLINNRVRVEIELVSSDYTLPSNFGTEETRYQNLLQAQISIDQLLQLANDPNVKFIRTLSEAILLQ